MKTAFKIAIVLALSGFGGHAQVKVGDNATNVNGAAMLEVESLTKGFLAPRMTTAQRNALPLLAQGLVIYNTTEECLNYYDGTAAAWKSLCSGGGPNPTVTAINCASASQSGNVITGQPVSGATVTITYTGGNSGTYPAGSPIASSGGTVTGLTLTLQAGNLANGNGTLVYSISGTPSGTGTALFSLAFGGQVCTGATITATAAASIASLTCTTAQTGTLTVGTPASGVTFTVPYTGGNGAAYNGGAGISSTGVTGLTATLVAGTLTNSTGNLTYVITGTPSGSGPAYFNLVFGGANCAGATANVVNATTASSSFADNADFGGLSADFLAVCADGFVLGQGGNTSGLLGTGNNAATPSGSLSSFAMTAFGPASKATAVSIGYIGALIIKEDATLWATGSNQNGGLGLGASGASFNTAQQVPGTGGSGFLTDVKAVVSGYYLGIALKNDGSVYGFGYNNYGQIGNGTTVTANYPVQVKGIGGTGFLTSVTALATNEVSPGHVLALRNDGSVVAWGNNTYGQLGNATTVSSSTPVQVKGASGIGNLSNVKAIAATDISSAAVLNDGTVYAWGYNGTGEAGQNNTSPNTIIAPIQVKGPSGTGFLTGIIDVKATYRGFLALKSDGTVWAWGYNGEGQNGDNTTTQNNAPVQVKGVGGTGFLTGITSIIGGGRYSAGAIGNGGQLYGWGHNGNHTLAPTVSGQQLSPTVLTNFCVQQ